MGAFAGTQFGGIAGMGNVFGGGCQKVDSVTIPSVRPQWTCGLESTGRWTCAGQVNMQYLVLLLHVWHHYTRESIQGICSDLIGTTPTWITPVARMCSEGCDSCTLSIYKVVCSLHVLDKQVSRLDL